MHPNDWVQWQNGILQPKQVPPKAITMATYIVYLDDGVKILLNYES